MVPAGVNFGRQPSVQTRSRARIIVFIVNETIHLGLSSLWSLTTGNILELHLFATFALSLQMRLIYVAGTNAMVA